MWAAALKTAGQTPARDTQGPRGYPIVGVLPYVRKDPLRFFLSVSQTYGDVIPLALGTERVFLINHPDHLHHILQGNAKNYRKSKFSKRLSPMLGDGILICDGDVWKRQRNASRPAFSANSLSSMCSEMVLATDAMLQRWSSRYRDGDIIDVSIEMMHLTLDITLRSLFGTRLGAAEFKRTYQAVTEFLRVADRGLWSPIYMPVSVPTPGNRRYRKAIDDVNDIVDEILRQRRSMPEGKEDLLQYLISEYGTGTDARRDLRDVIVSMLFASHETTAAGLTWTCHLLSKHPAITRRMSEEIGGVLSARHPEFSDHAKLPFTKAVFEEAIRLYPPLWSTSRDAIEDDQLGDVRIPAGATVVMCIYAIQRSPRYWDNPEGFDPERFLAGNNKQRIRCSYLPFGDGPRTCLGSRFAVMEAVTVLSMLIQRYRLDMVPGHPVEPDPMITLRPRFGMPMRLRRIS